MQQSTPWLVTGSGDNEGTSAMLAPAIIDTLSLLTPFDIRESRKVKIGNRQGDGGYVLYDHLRATQPVYSFGISTEVSFDLELAERGHTILMFDHTIEELPVKHPRFVWKKLGIAGETDPELPLLSLSDHLRHNGHGGASDIILKMDVEGWEWDVLSRAPSSLLGRFEQIAFEAHGLNHLDSRHLRTKINNSLINLNNTHVLFHVHANNTVPVSEVCGITCPEMLELSYVRRDLVTICDSGTVYPTALDCANIPSRPDTVLDFFPFLPGSLSGSELKRRVREAAALACRHCDPAGVECQSPAGGVNIAPLGKASQSSLSKWSTGPDDAGGAICGFKDGTFGFHTNLQKDPWWRLEFAELMQFDEIVVYNRLNARERCANLLMSISEDGVTWRVLYRHPGIPFGGILGDPLRVECHGTSARFIELRALAETYLHLDQVEVIRILPEQPEAK
jgi:hypothetical protein